MGLASSSGQTAHKVQLDGLRTLAVGAVLWYHWVHLRHYGIPWGPLGVQLFFVLSGFLITGILLNARYACEDSSRMFVLRQFYARRFLRIFPLFYATIMAGCILGMDGFRASWEWHAAYLSNVYFWRLDAWVGHLGHFWSLSVEEQFYLVWPLAMLFAPRRLLLPLIVSAICAAPLFRFAMAFAQPQNTFSQYLTPSHFDSLGVGAVIAYAQSCFGRDQQFNINPHYLLVAGVAMLLPAILIAPLEPLRFTAQALLFGWLVLRAADGFTGAFGMFLSSTPITYFGRISYGIYILHVFAIDLLDYAVTHLGIPSVVIERGLFRVPALAVLTLAMASLSWHAFESTLNNLKRHFPYQKDAARLRDSVSTDLQGMNIQR